MYHYLTHWKITSFTEGLISNHEDSLQNSALFTDVSQWYHVTIVQMYFCYLDFSPSFLLSQQYWLGLPCSGVLAGEGTGIGCFEQAAHSVLNPFARNTNPWMFSRNVKCVDFYTQNNKHNCACLTKKKWKCSSVTHSGQSSRNTFTLSTLSVSQLGFSGWEWWRFGGGVAVWFILIFIK